MIVIRRVFLNSQLVFSISKITKNSLLPIHESEFDLANRFAEHMHQKVIVLRDSLRLNRLDCQSLLCRSSETCLTTIKNFEYVSSHEIMKIISTTSNSTCHLDPLPVSIFRKRVNPLLLPLSLIINRSLSTGVLPSIWKKSLVFPTLKKASLDPENLFNYRPISNLSSLSKVIECVIVLNYNLIYIRINLFPTRQSPYRRYHSAETMMLKITNDLALSLDKNMDVAFVFLDLSSAFDTVDHNLLLQILEEKFGFTGIVQKWAKSYLAERIQTVVISKVESQASPMSRGVPQGSVLGPLLFYYTSLQYKKLHNTTIWK